MPTARCLTSVTWDEPSGQSSVATVRSPLINVSAPASDAVAAAATLPLPMAIRTTPAFATDAVSRFSATTLMLADTRCCGEPGIGHNRAIDASAAGQKHSFGRGVPAGGADA